MMCMLCRYAAFSDVNKQILPNSEESNAFSVMQGEIKISTGIMMWEF